MSGYMKTDSKSIYFTESTGGHVALDLLNTVAIANGQMVDSLQTDADVKTWLLEHAVVSDRKALEITTPGLAKAAHALREVIRDLISAKKEGRALKVEPLNAYLQHGASYLQLAKSDAKHYYVERVRQIESVEQLLAPIAEAAAELIALEDFSVVRKCESPDCVLWFYDRTKGHKRRWCSMAICGNRHKVASYRKRQNA
jgi:predicted RNA-binding Zn ribbon-like protein